MIRLSLCHGTLPTKEQFNRAVLESFRPNRPFRFRKDVRLGTVDLTAEELWEELRKAKQEGTIEALRWCCNRLLEISIEWN